jgi:hypothetical protein
MRILAVLFSLSVLACSNGSGPVTCNSDYDCSGTLICNTTTHKCEPFVCKTDTDCVKPGMLCRSNQCVEQDAFTGDLPGTDVNPQQ